MSLPHRAQQGLQLTIGFKLAYSMNTSSRPLHSYVGSMDDSADFLQTWQLMAAPYDGSAARCTAEQRRAGAIPTLCTLVAGALMMMILCLGTTVQAANDKVPPEPSDYRLEDYRKPVPATLKGARVVDGEEAEKIWEEKAAVFIDVYPQAPKPPGLPEGTIWRTPRHTSIQGAHWLANVGYGVLSPAIKTYFDKHLTRLTGGDKAKPVVFFCLRNCWMSWNAAKRAVEWGYTNVIWFPDGVDSWKEFALPVEKLKPVE